MKKCLIGCILIITIAIFGESQTNNFLGKWRVEIVGFKNTMIIEFYENNVYSVTEMNTNIPTYFNYSIDQSKKMINLGELSTTEMPIEFEIKYDFTSPKNFRLFMTDDQADKLLGVEIENTIPEDASEFTKNYYKSIFQLLKKAMISVPLAEGKKL